jgi:cobalt-precorrin 5A hydrolase / precorrin-3B C17-methyltransferase
LLAIATHTVLWIGIGCKRGTSCELIASAVTEVLHKNHLAVEAIAGIATIDRKVDEIGLIEFCRDRNLPLITYPAEILRTVCVPNPSDIVAEIGTPSVAEAAALYAASLSHAKALMRPGVSHQLLPKQIFHGVLTVAVAILLTEQDK